MKSSILVKLIVCLFTAFECYVKAQNPSEQKSIWEVVDIIPMPKEIKLTDNNLILNQENITIVIGQEPVLQSQIGADWINQRLAEVGNAPALPIIAGSELPEGKTCIIIGTASDNPLIAQAVKDKVVNVGANNPGERGYEIRHSADGKRIYLAGADNIGALYACVTFGELLEMQDDRTAWRAAEVRDWPDIIHMTMGGDFVGSSYTPELMDLFNAIRHNKHPPPALREQYLRILHELQDWMLRRKVTSMNYALGHLQGRRIIPAAGDGGEVIRAGIAYGRERGIGAIVFSVVPFVGRSEFHPELKEQALPPSRYPEWIRSWSMDNVRRETAENLALLMRHYGITDLAFHDSDLGGVNNPAQWNDRSAADKQRWGDDYVAATAHIHREYYDAIRKFDPAMRLHFLIYPYVVEVLDEETGEWYLRQPYAGGAKGSAVREQARVNAARYEIFWRRMHELMPSDVTFGARETKSAPMAKFRAIISDRPVFLFLGLTSPTFLAESCRAIGTFYNNHDDFIFTTLADRFVPFNSLAVREYAWNASAPGAAPFGEQAPTHDLYKIVLPRIVRNLFGRTAAHGILAAVSEPLAPSMIADIKELDLLQKQAAMAKRGARALDIVWEKCRTGNDRQGMDDYAFRRFINLREVFHTCMWVAEIRAQELLARKQALNQNGAAANAAIQNGMALLQQARADFARLLAERPDDPVLRKQDHNRWSAGWRAHMADQVDLGDMEKHLIHTQSELKELAARGTVPPGVIDKFADGRGVRVTRTVEAITVDGALNEPAWSNALPVECFFVLGAGKVIARADTRARLIYDTNALYVGFNVWTPNARSPSDTDMLELFLCAPGLNKDYVHFMISATGKVRQQYNRIADGVVLQDNAWQCPGLESAVNKGTNRWDLELKIPMAALASQPCDGWSVNLMRVCPLDRGPEVSTILPPGAESAHAVKLFAPMAWDSKAVHSAECTIKIMHIESGAVTLRDRINGEVQFWMELTSGQILHDIEVRAEVRDLDGKQIAETTLLALPCIYYHWQSDAALNVVLPDECHSGTLCVRITSAEGIFERTEHFGSKHNIVNDI